MKKTYWEKLRDPRWQKRRSEIMRRDEFRCVECQDGNNTLNVHHRYYVSGRDPWDYPDWSLRTLCEPCHDGHHNPPEGEQVGFEEWETEMDWITLGSGSNGFIGSFWYAAIAILKARQEFVDDQELVRAIEEACEKLQEEKIASGKSSQKTES